MTNKSSIHKTKNIITITVWKYQFSIQEIIKEYKSVDEFLKELKLEGK